jgi:beta-D-xylosidase 4
MASAFDDDLIERVGEVIGTEARAFGNMGYSGYDYWMPDVNPYRDPRWGRGAETAGEDVLRIKRFAASMVRGVEGPGPQRRIIATCKHYAGNDIEAWHNVTRHDFDARITTQDLAEYFLQPFQTCARDVNVGSIMCSYNAVNGVPSCASSYLLQAVLRDHWGWTADNNYVTSDCEAVADIALNHHYAPTNAAGTADAFNAGTDNSCEYEGSSDIPGAWASGALNESTVDRALLRLYEGLVRTGYFDGATAEYATIGWSDVNTPAAQKLALQAAVDGIVLLKNDGTLPLNLAAGSKVAMIGFWAADESKIQGGYSGTAPYLRTPVWAAKQLGYDVRTAPGPVLQTNSAPDNWTTAALAVAEGANYILYFGGQDTSVAAEGLDRTSLDWPAAQLTLLDKLSGLGKPIVVVQLGDQLDNMPLLANKAVNAVMWTSWPGQEGGTAVVQLVSGAASPAGRLPVTQYPAAYTQLAMTYMNLRPSGASPGRTYRWFPDAVQPFGYGLHYTRFKASFAGSDATYSVSDLVKACSDKHRDRCPLPPLQVVVANTGSRTSDYVALAFVRSEAGPKPYPRKTLGAYGRARDVSAGQAVTLELAWTLGNLARHDAEGNTVLYPGSYTVVLDEPEQEDSFIITLTGCKAVLDRWPAPPPFKSL